MYDKMKEQKIFLRQRDAHVIFHMDTLINFKHRRKKTHAMPESHTKLQNQTYTLHMVPRGEHTQEEEEEAKKKSPIRDPEFSI